MTLQSAIIGFITNLSTIGYNDIDAQINIKEINYNHFH